MANMILLVILFIASLSVCDAYKILVLFPFPTRSHGILGDGVVRHLLNAGHEVTYLTPYPKNGTNPRLHEVDLSEGIESFESMMEEYLNLKKLMDNRLALNAFMHFIWFSGNMMSTKTLEYKNLQNLLSDKSQHFDLIIVEWLFNDLYTTIAAVYDAPLVIFSSMEPHWMVTSLIDEALDPAYNGFFVNAKPPLSFAQRVKEMFFTLVQTILRHTAARYLDSGSYNRLIAPHITARGRTPPDYIDLLYNASLIIGNSHVSMGDAKTLPQNYINIGGYHIQEKTTPLPEDLKKIIESAKHGVIYFSMGTNVQSKHLPDETKKQILKVFGTLKQTVLWKLEEKLPNLPANVHILEWAPQQSILAHPNVILFITHGGLLSTTEAIYAGKPIIGIPVFSDQFVNVKIAVSRGFAKKVDLSYKMADNLKTVIDEILGDPKYGEKAKELSFIHHDRPVKPGDELIHWVEHVIKTGGAAHLRCSAFMVPWYQKLYLDLVLLTAFIVIAVRYVYRYIKRTFFTKKNASKKRN